MTNYTAIAGQSIYDVCLQTYGSLDFLFKLMQDNSIAGLNVDVLSGQKFVWDETLVVNQQLNSAFAASGINYATSSSTLGSVFFVETIQGGQIIQPNPTPTGGSGGGGGGAYSITLGTSFTSNVDNATVITPLDINGNTLVGVDIVQIEKETKPMVAADYSWNKVTGVLTLLNGNTCDQGMTLFILYSKIITA